MSPFDPQRAPPTEIVTTGGVKVVVREVAPRETTPEPTPEPAHRERVVVRPPPDPHQARNDLVAKIWKEHGALLLRTLTRSGVNPASTKELAQEVIIILTEYVDKHKTILNEPGFLVDVAKKELQNRSRRRQLPVDREADAAERVDSAPDPQQAILLAEHRAKVAGCVERLPKKEADVVRHVDLQGDTIETAAAKLGLARTTAFNRLTRGRARLAEILREPEPSSGKG